VLSDRPQREERTWGSRFAFTTAAGQGVVTAAELLSMVTFAGGLRATFCADQLGSATADLGIEDFICPCGGIEMRPERP
jgi:hypothetical protein